MELIDTHQHLMYRDQVGYSWANEFPPIDKGNLPSKIIKNLQKILIRTLFMKRVSMILITKETKFINQ